MGYMRHNAIIVSGSHYEGQRPIEESAIGKAHAEATRLFKWVSPLSPGGPNGGRSFLVPPDDSKEGWPESDQGDERRLEFVKFLRSQEYDDGSSPLDWVEVQYGDENMQTCVVDDSDAARRLHERGSRFLSFPDC